jgi:poly(A) polymerase
MAPHERLQRVIDLVAPVAAAFREAGFELYAVGGCIRDAFLDIESRSPDIDLTTNARPADIERLLAPLCAATWDMGREFGTIGGRLRGGDTIVEITTYRRELYRGDSRKPEVTFGDSLAEDLVRRDFTINAMAFDVINPGLVDPVGGASDLNANILRAPMDPVVLFSEDPLRMLRAARFSARFGFALDPSLEAAATQLAERLSIVSPERIRGELDLLMVTTDPTRGLDFITRTGLAAYFLPELPSLALEQDPVHRHKDVLTHTYAVVAKATAHDLTLRLACLFHDIGKPKTRAFTDGGVTFHGHDHVGARMTRKRMSALHYSQEMIDDVSTLVEMHLRFHTYQMGWSDSAVRRYVRDAGHLLDQLNELTRCDCTTRNKRKAEEMSRRMDELEARIARLREQEDLDALRPALDGLAVMELLEIGPSRAVGEALEFLLQIRLDEGEIDPAEAARRLRGWWIERQA